MHCAGIWARLCANTRSCTRTRGAAFRMYTDVTPATLRCMMGRSGVGRHAAARRVAGGAPAGAACLAGTASRLTPDAATVRAASCAPPDELHSALLRSKALHFTMQQQLQHQQQLRLRPLSGLSSCRAGANVLCASSASRGGARKRLVCRAAEELDMVDPISGEVISRSSVYNKAAGFTVDAGGVTWAYRQSQPKEADASKLKVLLLHGLGSSSYSYRRTLAMLGDAGYEAYAPDWPGHGSSSKPSSSGGVFNYSQAAYLAALEAFVAAVGLDKQPYALVVQGYVLGQYGLLHALAHEQQVARLFILNTPLALNSKLRPELAAFKSPIPFMRPGNKPFDGMTFNMAGSPYAMLEADAVAYGQPYQDDPAASAAVSATMAQLDFGALLKAVDDGFRSWRQPSLVLFGANDPFVDVKSAFAFLDSKRTSMRMVTATAKLGHMPQEDYPEAIQDTLEAFLAGETDSWEAGRVMAGKMTKRGVEFE